MIITIAVLVFFLGASFGSFYYTLAGRIIKYFYSQERKKYSFNGKIKNILLNNNSCDNCHKNLEIIETIPVLGFIINRGKCPKCQNRISFVYPVIEVIFGLEFIFVFFLTENPVLSFAIIILSGHLLVSAVTDWKFQSLDYENLFFIIISGFIVLWQFEEIFTITQLYIFSGFFVFYFLFWLFLRRYIGFGDVIFSPFFAVIAGHPWWLLYLNISYGLAIINTLLFRKKEESLKNAIIPMGAYLALGLFITLNLKIYFIYRTLHG